MFIIFLEGPLTPDPVLLGIVDKIIMSLDANLL